MGEYRTFCFIITLLNKGWVQFIDTRRKWEEEAFAQ